MSNLMALEALALSGELSDLRVLKSLLSVRALLKLKAGV